MASTTPEQRRWTDGIERGVFGVWDLDPRLDRVHYAPEWKRRMGFARVEAADCTSFWRCRVHPQDLDAMLGALRRHLDGFSDHYQARFRVRSNGSGYRLMLSRGRVTARDARGDALRMVGTMVDLTERAPAPAPCGLVVETGTPASTALRSTPFHALLCAAPGAAQTGRLLDLMDDLLDIAWREGSARLR